MNRSEFLSYKNRFVNAKQQILLRETSKTLSEAAFPAYTNRNPLISFLFWHRVRKVMSYLGSTMRFERAMDFGCGGGVMLPFLSQISRSVIAVDIDLSPLKKMESYVTFPDNIEIHYTHQIKSGDFAHSFDVILALDVLEHVEDLDNTLANLCQLLAPKGQIIISGPTENFAYQIGRKIAGSDYSGEYHVRNIYDIREILAAYAEVSTIATLFYPVPLFKIYCGRISTAASYNLTSSFH